MTWSKLESNGNIQASSPLEARRHIPVMVREVIQYLEPHAGGVYVDGTFGAGGYSRAILDGAPESFVLGIDRDPEAVPRAVLTEADYPGRFSFERGRFGNLIAICEARGIRAVNGIVLDIGVSSPQIDQASRGFSFMHDGPLDMRMEMSGLSAADVVNTYREEDLANLIYELGDERASRRIARRICETRIEKLFSTTRELASVIRSVVRHGADGIDPATRTFQALRIHVNDELGELSRCLEAAEKLLAPGGRLVVVSFHSLEDRIVKHFLRKYGEESAGTCRHMPQPKNLHQPSLKILTKKVVFCQGDELKVNPRARSARLRAAEKRVQRI